MVVRASEGQARVPRGWKGPWAVSASGLAARGRGGRCWVGWVLCSRDDAGHAVPQLFSRVGPTAAFGVVINP